MFTKICLCGRIFSKQQVSYCLSSTIQTSETATDFAFTLNSQVAKGSDLYRVDKSTKLCMVVA